MQSGRGDRGGNVEPDYRFRTDERNGVHLLGDCDECLWDQLGIAGIELGDAGGACFELHLHGTRGGCAEYGVVQLYGVAQRSLQRDRHGNAVGGGVIDPGGSDVQQLGSAANIHRDTLGDRSGHAHSGQQRLTSEPECVDLRNTSLGAGDWHRNHGKCVGIGALYGAGGDRRVGRNHLYRCVHPRRGHGDGIGESDYSFGADQRDGLHLLGDCDECLWDQFGLVGIELGDASGARVELHLYGALGGRIERSVIQLHGDAQRILQRNRYTHAVGRRVIDSGGADVQRLIGGTDIHHHAHGRGSGHTRADEQRLAYESGGARLCDASPGAGHWNRDSGEWIGIGELHAAGVNRRVSDYLLPGDLQSGRGDGYGHVESDHSFGVD